VQPLPTRINGPVAVIGDVHGHVKKLLTILEKLQSLPDFEQRWLVFIGDFVDRGPDSKETLDVVIDLLTEHPRTTAIAGNHELAMAASLDLVRTPDYSNWTERWLEYHDAKLTFESYGAEFGNLEELRDLMPGSHQEFLAGLPWCVEHPRFLFVHAGLDPNTPFGLQLRILQQKDCSLNRPQWLCSKALIDADVPPDCPVTVVSGHVPVPKVIFRPQRILIDTTGGIEGDLSCVLLPEKQILTSDAKAAIVASPAEQSRAWWKLW